MTQGTGMSSDMEALKTKLRATWIAGDFGEIAKTYATDAEEFVRGLNLQPGMRVLDVACGTGNVALPAARLGAVVTGVDIAPNLIEQGREKAKREGLTVQFDEGDAENLPYEDASFDAVITMFGAMFAPRPELVAAELKRVVRPGGFIAMANWTPTGFIGQMFKIVGSHVSPPPNMPSPLMWGSEDVVRERLREGISDLQTSRQSVNFILPFSPAQTVEQFLIYYGPTNKAYNTLDENGKAAFRRDLEQHWTTHNRATDGTTVVTSEYLKVVAVRA
ncbi:MAG: class I SAM-dependent methyltransferase [Acidobacteria bacterium]|nr:class I SAM-dependent methyltransferase [Acidobacteriota bacterium]